MNELMTQGFEELNDNELDMVDGGFHPLQVIKGVGQVYYGAGCMTYYAFKGGTISQYNKAYNTMMNGSYNVLRGIFT